MKKSMLALAIGLAIMPILVTAENIPVTTSSTPAVTQEADIPLTPAPKGSTVAQPISTTASSETNRAVREYTSAADRINQEIATPDAVAFASRLQVGVRPATIKANYLDMTYPDVKAVSPIVQKQINNVILKYVKKVEQETLKHNLNAADKDNVVLTYDVKTNDNGIFSVLITTYTIQDKAANGVNYVKSFTFNTTTGRQLSLSDFGSISEEQIRQALLKLPREQRALLDETTDLKKLKDAFYAEANHDIILIGQQGTIAPHSAGTIYLPMGQLREIPK